ncbi:hypothetical protein [Hydrogenophaga sp. BPS33]|uniref:hypothetical protein n=1 Tax=Hydrogenophaga sp. BPS33 TaxID=2651974 RepID=UPI00131F8695|nr:hypothetical protein [Hydrogenophaga sp. BPS33]QHE84487.1 hypothetical protein F9K07_06085 [Hydrogenophaga sp. BPS33]
MNVVDWAQVVGAAGSFLAVVVSLGSVFVQRCREKRAAKRADASLLLSLQNLASELGRMNVLAGFQIDAPGNELIYPNIAAEFSAMSRLLEDLPTERLSLLGKMSVVLHLRRIAAELAMLYNPAPKAGSNFYLVNRVRLGKLKAACSTYSLQLIEEIKRLDTEIFEANVEQMNRL